MSSKKEQVDTSDKLVDSVKSALDEAEVLLKKAAAETGEKASELREQALDQLRRTRLALYDVQDSLVEKSRQAVRDTDDYVHDNPWQAITISAAAGLLIGLLIGRR